jgi:DNA repair protein RecO (recombination protein O)
LTGLVGGVRDNGGVQGYRDDGVVLRTQKLGEADRIITLLTRHNGRVRAVAKGIRRTKSKFGGRLEPFTHVDVMVHHGRTLDTITQAEVIKAYGKPLGTDYPKYTAGTAMLETAERFTPVEREPAIRQFLLLIGGLRALGDAVDPVGDDQDAPGDVDPALDQAAPGAVAPAAGGRESPRPAGPFRDEHPAEPGAPEYPAEEPEPARRDPRMVLDAYFLRSLTFAGYAPALEECARCGAPSPDREAAVPGREATVPGRAASAPGDGPEPGAAARPLVAFAVAAGGMVCAADRPPGAASPAPQTVALMIDLLSGEWDKAMRSERRHRVECSGLVAAYLQWHLEHSIRSLRHVERA